jgi:hypothetical protein
MLMLVFPLMFDNCTWRPVYRASLPFAGPRRGKMEIGSPTRSDAHHALNVPGRWAIRARGFARATGYIVDLYGLH